MATIRPRAPQEPFNIHHDDMDESMEENDEMEESKVEDGEEMEVEDNSEDSDSDQDVDASVKEDIRKFQETFKGINERFRLINRIGEGKQRLLERITITDRT